MDRSVLHHEVAQLLYREARMLDEGRFAEWLELWSDDALYCVPTAWTSNRSGLREADEGELHHLRSNKDVLKLRVRKLESGSAWAEEPRSRTVRTVSNIEVYECDDGIRVHSNIVLHRIRYTDDVEIHAGARLDRLVRCDAAWRIARRSVRLAHGVLRADNFELFL